MGLVENDNNRYRGFCKNNDMQESSKGNSHGGRGGGIFGTIKMSISETKIGGDTKHHHLYMTCPSKEAAKADEEEEGGGGLLKQSGII